MFQEPHVFFKGKQVPNLVDLLDQAILGTTETVNL